MDVYQKSFLDEINAIDTGRRNWRYVYKADETGLWYALNAKAIKKGVKAMLANTDESKDPEYGQRAWYHDWCDDTHGDFRELSERSVRRLVKQGIL